MHFGKRAEGRGAEPELPVLPELPVHVMRAVRAVIGMARMTAKRAQTNLFLKGL